MSLALSALRQCLPAASHWMPEKDMPDLTGKVAAVTGGYAGIGTDTCRALLRANATVFILGRSEEKARKTVDELKAGIADNSKGTVEFIMCDLADLDGLRKTAEVLSSKTDHLDMLFNNGGVMMPPPGSTTDLGYDLQFGTNVLGHYHLTNVLLPLLFKSPYKAEGYPRVMNTSSIAHYLFAPKGGIKWGSLKKNASGSFDEVLSKETLYGQSKLGNILLSNELHRRYADQGLVSVALNPGNIKTELYRHQTSVANMITGIALYPPAQGAVTQLWAATSPEGAHLGGKYLIPWSREGQTTADGADAELAKKVWEWCERECAAH